MRIARKVVLLSALALSAMALAASSASATEAVTVAPEAGGTCATGCTVHAVGTSSLTAFHLLPVSACRDEFVATINSNGSGFIHDYTNQDNGGPGCTRQNCNGVGEPASEREWDITSEETGPNVGEMNVQFCLDEKANPNGTGTHCTAVVAVTEPSSHNYAFNLNQECSAAGVPVRVTGSWATEAAPPTEGQRIEITHN
jgi:hypothetical protein